MPRRNSSDAKVKLLKERVEPNQGLSLQELTGHLSQMLHFVRTKCGRTVKSRMIFLHKLPTAVAIRDERNGYVRTKSRQPTSSLNAGSVESFTTSTSDRATDDECGTCSIHVRGASHHFFILYGSSP
ncbi:uncharacterized protein LOC144148556 [Haemaphysalis longicornis]